MIQYTTHSHIDRQKWDACITSSQNRLPYALTWWLDEVCPQWDALVLDDYKAVMPLSHGRKFGIRYLYQPYLTQQLGIFSISKLTPETIKDFLSAIPRKYKYVRIQLNPGNIIQHTDILFSTRKDYILDLTDTATGLAGRYHRNCRRNIQHAVNAGLSVKPGPAPSEFALFIKENLHEQITIRHKSFYPMLDRITAISIQQGSGEIAGVYMPTGELTAAGWFVTTMGRCLFLVCASTAQGKKNQAMYMLVNHMISKNAGSGLTFDFTGSNIPGIEYFNSGFGSTETHYPVFSRNLLPWPLNNYKL